ncbi:uncharacterized protein [Typha angustifolia]|uniref:uncharacterized protein n=1 Tax=Typha angustifolia TaxID=59011 RepID=UPI003C2BC81D
MATGAISAAPSLHTSAISNSLPVIFNNSRLPSSLSLTTPIRNPRSGRSFAVFAASNRLKREDNGDNGRDLKEDQKTPFEFRWRDLLNPDPENLVAVGLTGLLTWASVQVLFQIFVISTAILLAALKYSFVAALLLFIVITLL